MSRLLLIIIALCGLHTVHAQRPSSSATFSVSGKVVDKDSGIPLEYATVALANVNTPNKLEGGITDANGNFTVEVPRGVYTISIEYISFETFRVSEKRINQSTDLGTIKLGIAAGELDEVVVIAEKTTVDIKLDKKIYTIGKDITTSGATVSDALNNVPSVTVDIDGAISLRGNENVRILINGRPSAIAGFGSTDALRQLPAEAIERVEVITSPSARYDAEGTAGILNIILRKEKTLGLNGSLRVNAGYPTNSGLNTNINLRTDKFNIFNTTSLRYRNSPGNAFFDTRYFTTTRLDEETGEVIQNEPRFDRNVEDRSYDRLNRGFNSNLGFEYFLTEKSSLTATAFLRIGNDIDTTTNISTSFNENVLEQNILREEIETEDDNNYQFTLNYINNFDDNGHKLTADLQYGSGEEIEHAVILEEDRIPTLERLPTEVVTTLETQREYLAQADYVLPIGEEAQFEAGYRGNFENTVTDFEVTEESAELSGNFVRNDSLSNIFEFDQNVHAVYTQFGSKIGKLSYLLGLRMETTQLIGEVTGTNIEQSTTDELNINFDKDYIGLFPTLNLIFELQENESISLGYNRRINRPRGFFLNPFPSRSSEANVFQGNPSLDPAYANAFDLGYLRKWEKLTLTSSIYYQMETNAFERVEEDTGQQTPNGINIIRRIPINLATNERYGFEAGALYNPKKWLRLNGSFNLFGFKNEGEFNGVTYDAENISWFGRFSSKVTLPAKIDWQTNAFYRGPRENAQTKTDGIFSLDLAFSKDFMNDNATIAFNVSDLFNSRKRRSFTDTPSFSSDSEFQWRERQFTMAFTYRFNEKKQRSRGRSNDAGDDGDFEG